MRTDAEYTIRLKSQRLADLRERTAELERELSDARDLLENEPVPAAASRDTELGQFRETYRHTRGGMCRDQRPGRATYAARPARGHGGDNSGRHVHSAGRTARLLDHGRSNFYQRGPSRGWTIGAGTIALALVVTILLMVVPGGGGSWPASVATVQNEIAQACQNPDVRSEPGQVNFACGKTTRQILWVFALMTSGNNPNFADPRTGRQGLEPITPAQGGQVAWSLNLHHPYNPANPIDSLEVAARAINDIIGGATITGAHGNPVVQPGLEGKPTNCARYTGSAAITSRAGFPGLCAKPVTSPHGQAALVADVFRKWVVGAPAAAARDAAVLFANAKNPASPQVQAILKHLPYSELSA